MSKYNLFSFFIIGLIGGFLIGTNPVYANTRAIGPQPIIPTDIAKGTLFVKPNGSGNICSKASPCNIWTAVNKASSGDVVFLRGGTYAVHKDLRFNNIGTAGNPVIFESYPDELAVFDGSQLSIDQWIQITLSGKFIHIRGIEVRNMPKRGIVVTGTDNIIEGSHIHHNKLSGIWIFAEDGSDDTKASRNIIRNNTLHDNSGAGLPEKPYNDGGNSDGIGLYWGYDNRIENNLTYRNSDDGIDTWKSMRTYVGYNIVHSNGLGEKGEGHGVKAGSEFSANNATHVEHNLSYSNKRNGFNSNGGGNVTFIHNTSWNNKAGYKLDADTVTTKNIALDANRWSSTGIETDNSWQRSGDVAFISYNPSDPTFLVPVAGGGFDDIGALPFITSASITSVASVIGPQPITPTDISEGTLFVEPNGSGSICSMASPCNIWTAVNKASGGDVVFLRGGTYAVHKNLRFNNIGTAENPVIFESYPDELAVFDGSQLSIDQWIQITLSGKFIYIRGIEVKNMPTRGIYVTGTDNIIEGSHIHHNKLSGIQIWAADGSDDTKASRNIIRNNRIHDNSGADYADKPYNSGGNTDGVGISWGYDNRIENNMIYRNSDDGIDTWRSQRSYVGYNIVHSNGLGDLGEGHGIKAGGNYPSADTMVEHNLSYSNKRNGFNSNDGRNITFSHNTAWNNKAGYKVDSDTVLTKNITLDANIKWGAGIETDNSWQRSGDVAFVSTDPNSTNFLVPESDGGFEDIGAIANATNANTANDNTTSLPDVIVTQLSYADGIFTSTVKNQGSAATPEGVAVAVGYSVDGQYKTWGGINGPLAAGESVVIGTKLGKEYTIPDGTHTITAWVDDENRFEESNKDNNQLSELITISGSGDVETNTETTATTSLPDVIVTQLSYADGIFTSTVENRGNAATPEGVAVAVGYSVDGKYKTWGGINGPLAAGESVIIGTKLGKEYTIPDGTHTIMAWVDDENRFEESNENNNRLSQSITVQ